jgi:hypothetical protein
MVDGILAHVAQKLRELPRVTEPDGSQWVDFEMIESLAVEIETATE